MSEETKETKEAAGGKKKSPMKLVIVAVLLLGCIGGGVMVMKSKSKAKKPAPEKLKVVAMFELDEFLVNLNDEHYLRMTIALGLTKKLGKEEDKELAPEIRHIVIMTLSDKTMDELLSEKGKMELAEELKTKINAYMAEKEGGGAEEPKSEEPKAEEVKKEGEHKPDDQNHGAVKENEHKESETKATAHKTDEHHKPFVLEIFFSNFAMQ